MYRAIVWATMRDSHVIYSHVDNHRANERMKKVVYISGMVGEKLSPNWPV